MDAAVAEAMSAVTPLPSNAAEVYQSVLPALAGMYIGQLVRDKLRPDVFRLWFFIGLAVLGAY